MEYAWIAGAGVRAFLALPLAIAVVRIRSSARWVAILIAYGILADLFRWGIELALSGVPVPYVGVARLAFHGHTAALWGWMAAVPALAWFIFRQTSARWILVLYGTGLFVLCAGYPAPWTRQRGLAWAYAVAHWVATAIMIYSAARWFRHGKRPEIEHRICFWLIAFEATLIAGPYLPTGLDPFGRWIPADVSYLLLYLVMSVVLGRYLWVSRSGSPGSLPSAPPFRLH